ncbi:MAG TPA: hypothetical protein VID47_03595 [Actinomycetota bacterium]|jgi:hypothetical protein
MADRRGELIAEEDDRWTELCAVLTGVPHERLLEPGVFEQWSPKDLMAHLGCWMAEAASVLEQIRFGTYESTDVDVDAMNQRFYEAMRDQALRDVWAEMESARTRMFQEWAALPEVTADAEEWFVESGPAHVTEHLPELRAFLGRDGGAA